MSATPDRPVRLVVAAAVTDSLFLPRRLLSARRSTPQALAGLWEFPGGKVESGEQPGAALKREIFEELGIEIHVGDEISGPEHADRDLYGNTVGRCWELHPVTDDGERLVMRVWWAEPIDGAEPTVNLTNHSEVRWLDPGNWFDVGWIPADNRIVSAVIDDAAARHRRAYC